MNANIEKEYPYHIRDVHISDPSILTDSASQTYDTYVQAEMQETFEGVRMINEVTGNWYNHIDGIAKGYAYKDECIKKAGFCISPVAEKCMESKGVEGI